MFSQFLAKLRKLSKKSFKNYHFTATYISAEACLRYVGNPGIIRVKPPHLEAIAKHIHSGISTVNLIDTG